MQDPNTPNNATVSAIPIPGVVPPGGVAGATPSEPLMQFSSSSAMPGVTPASSPAQTPLQTTGQSPMPPTPGLQPAGSPQVTGTQVGPSAAPQSSSSPTGKEDTNVVKPGEAATTAKAPAAPKPTDAAKVLQPTSGQATDKEKSGQPQVRKADIEKVVSNWTGIPITKLTEDEGAKLLNLEKRVHQRLIDQEEAVTAVAEAVRRGRIGLAAANRPIASFIFLGPSGTGKTELAKTVAEILFGRDDAMVRLDMSEYMEKHEVAKLIGAPPGYVGYEEGGQLTEAVRAKPYSIVLLDEVEKAHPDVFNILLQLLEDGRLTDNKGNTISFKNTIVICTSNIGSAQITQKLGEKDGKPQTQEEIDKNFGELSGEVSVELHKFFRPELLNRFDDIVIFKPLRRQDMASIAKLGIEKTGKLLKEQDIKIKITDKGLQQLALEGYDPMYGARPLRRLIQTAIENPIAVLIIAKTFVPGDTIMIDYDPTKSDYSFRKATLEELAADAKKTDEEKLKGKADEKVVGNSEAPKDPTQKTSDQSTPSAQSTPSSIPGVTPPASPVPAAGSSVQAVNPPAVTSPGTPPSPTPTGNGMANGKPSTSPPPPPPTVN